MEIDLNVCDYCILGYGIMDALLDSHFDSIYILNNTCVLKLEWVE